MLGSSEPGLGEVAAVLRRHLPSAGWHAWLFGSRATGRATPRSDWDIGIFGPAPLRGAVLEAVREELEALRTLDTFDVVDLARVPEVSGEWRSRTQWSCYDRATGNGHPHLTA